MKLLYIMPFKVDVSRWNATGDCNIGQSVLKGYPSDWEIDVVGNFSSILEDDQKLREFLDTYHVNKVYDVSQYTPYRNYATQTFNYLNSLDIFKDYDLIQIHYSNPAIINPINKFLDNYPVILTIHAPPETPTFSYFSGDAYRHFLTRPKAMLVGVSDSHTDRMLYVLKYAKHFPDGPLPNITTIINGIPDKKLPDEEPYYDIGVIGRPSKSKSILESLQCAVAITKAYGGKGFYVGSVSSYEGDTPEEVKYRDQVKDLLDANPQIEWFKYQTSEEISKLMARSKCHISLSSIETFGLTIVEAGVQGTPCIGINKCGINDIIVDGVNGYKMHKDRSQLQNKLAKCLDLYEKCLKLDRDRVREFTLEEYHVDRMVQDYMNLVTKLTKE